MVCVCASLARWGFDPSFFFHLFFFPPVWLIPSCPLPQLPPRDEALLFISNHKCNLDWAYIWSIAVRSLLRRAICATDGGLATTGQPR